MFSNEILAQDFDNEDLAKSPDHSKAVFMMKTVHITLILRGNLNWKRKDVWFIIPRDSRRLCKLPLHGDLHKKLCNKKKLTMEKDHICEEHMLMVKNSSLRLIICQLLAAVSVDKGTFVRILFGYCFMSTKSQSQSLAPKGKSQFGVVISVCPPVRIFKTRGTFQSIWTDT